MNVIKDIIKGLNVTIRNMFKKSVTVQYPDERLKVPSVYRGLLHNDVPRCIACMNCARACPVDCFDIKFYMGEDKKRHITRFDINIFKCIFCGLCTEACPTKCLTMTGGYEKAVYDRDELNFHFIKEGEESIAGIGLKR